MKPYQFYFVDKFQHLEPGQSHRNEVQMSFLNGHEDVETVVRMERNDFEGDFSLLRIKSEIKHSKHGHIRLFADSECRKVDFNEYMEPVDFLAYHDPKKELMLFQAPKAVCKGVLSNLRSNPCGLELREVAVDFAKVLPLCDHLLGVWFKEVSARVKSAALSGSEVQEDPLFENVMDKGAELSNVTIPWSYDGCLHRLMITKVGAVVLVDDYRGDFGLELRLVMDVHEKLLSQVCARKKPGQ